MEKNSKKDKRENTGGTPKSSDESLKEIATSRVVSIRNRGLYPSYDIVEVEWLDAQSGFSSPITIEELESEKPLHTFSVGYLVKDDEEKVVLGFMMFGDEGMFKHWQLIPQGMIKKVTKLREGKTQSPSEIASNEVA